MYVACVSEKYWCFKLCYILEQDNYMYAFLACCQIIMRIGGGGKSLSKSIVIDCFSLLGAIFRTKKFKLKILSLNFHIYVIHILINLESELSQTSHSSRSV